MAERERSGNGASDGARCSDQHQLHRSSPVERIPQCATACPITSGRILPSSEFARQRGQGCDGRSRPQPAVQQHVAGCGATPLRYNCSPGMVQWLTISAVIDPYLTQVQPSRMEQANGVLSASCSAACVRRTRNSAIFSLGATLRAPPRSACAPPANGRLIPAASSEQKRENSEQYQPRWAGPRPQLPSTPPSALCESHVRSGQSSANRSRRSAKVCPSRIPRKPPNGHVALLARSLGAASRSLTPHRTSYRQGAMAPRGRRAFLVEPFQLALR